MAIAGTNGVQNQIKRTLSQPESIERVRAILEANEDLNRTRLANEVCEEFGFYDPPGQAQL